MDAIWATLVQVCTIEGRRETGVDSIWVGGDDHRGHYHWPLLGPSSHTHPQVTRVIFMGSKTAIITVGA